MMGTSMNGWVIMTLHALVRVLCLGWSLWGTNDRFKAGEQKINIKLTQIKYYSKMIKKPIYFVSFLKTFWSYDQHS